MVELRRLRAAGLTVNDEHLVRLTLAVAREDANDAEQHDYDEQAGENEKVCSHIFSY